MLCSHFQSVSGIINLLFLKVTWERGEGDPGFLTSRLEALSYFHLASSAVSLTVSISTPCSLPYLGPLVIQKLWNCRVKSNKLLVFYSSSTQNYFNSTEAQLKISYFKLSDIKDFQTGEIKQAQIYIALLGWMLSFLENTWVWRKSKANNHVGMDWQFFEETDFMHVVLQYVLQKVLTLSSICSFLTPKGHFGPQTSYCSWSLQYSELFPKESFPKEGDHCPDKACMCSWIVQQQRPSQLTETPRSRTETPALTKHMSCTRNPERELMGGAQSKVLFCAIVHREIGALHYLKLHQPTSSLGWYKMGQTKEQVQLLNSGT